MLNKTSGLKLNEKLENREQRTENWDNSLNYKAIWEVKYNKSLVTAIQYPISYNQFIQTWKALL